MDTTAGRAGRSPGTRREPGGDGLSSHQGARYGTLKQITLYVEPDNGRAKDGQWINVDGNRDTVFLAELLTKLGIRHQIKILAADQFVRVPKGWPPQLGDYDVYGVGDYGTKVDWNAPRLGLVSPFGAEYEVLKNRAKYGPYPNEMALVEYGVPFCSGATDPSCAYLKTLSSSSLVFQIYNNGFAGSLRWAFEPLYHPYHGFAVIKVEGVAYPAVLPGPPNDIDPLTTAEIIRAMKNGARFAKVPYTFEPQRLLNTNLRRGSTVYDVEIVAPIFSGKGVYAIAAKDGGGRWHVGLINLYSREIKVDVTFPPSARPNKLRWEYYNATLPEDLLQATAPAPLDGVVSLRLTPRSVNFLTE
jgi:hypothetical protein